ncbi:diguanylate cyclase [Thalassolituus hydrocarboniclasticus]|uniref:diguanylate cyclase n=1 Tax=Thalassolituus hydrocarboniclasticus TaxID=2742796 RepID=A0ABY6A6W7_9GAMM|nr:diguanylate cyclase [Thalassolituus hydrocarboniclasticus]UXD86674.1 diguanylate cyclase [Thalassolituus hydrocarboniclasticus]
MTDNLTPAARLKQHFSFRVINQVRQVIDLWRQLPAQHWSAERMMDFTLAVEKLVRFSQRFEAARHEKLARQLLSTLAHIAVGHSPDSAQLESLNQTIIALSKTALRHTDDKAAETLIPEKKPVYIALSNTDHALTMAEQMQYFGLRPELQRTAHDFSQALERRHPAAVVLDLDFAGPGQGLELAQSLQQSRENPLPVLFTYRETPPTLEQRLATLRNGGLGIYEEMDVQSVIGHLENLLDSTPDVPFKILIIDDSRAQATHTANVLNKAGMVTQVANDPLLVLDVLSGFTPDLILMDMYMPGCNGMELAKVIRQQREYINLPIIYLSGEEDRERQLAAMAEGGDDFLTKPVDPGHLLTTLRNRVSRARQLQNLIACDSLTGLLNHTHLLGALQDAMRKNEDVPISFVMVDIDHFKQVNDRYGHPAGDLVIRNLSLFLRQSLRKSDPIGRYGGEEFAIILIDATAQQARQIMDDIRLNFANLIHDGQSLRVTFSCGIAEWSGQSISELVATSDQALYRAKHNGRNQVQTAEQGE